MRSGLVNGYWEEIPHISGKRHGNGCGIGNKEVGELFLAQL